MNFVLDSSVVIKWYVPETLGDLALALKKEIEEESRPVAVPQLLFVELANVLWKKVSLKKELLRHDAEAVYSRISRLPFHVIEDQELLFKAMNLALDYSITVYDAVYLACAMRFNAVLITADLSLAKTFANSGIKRHIKFLGNYA